MTEQQGSTLIQVAQGIQQTQTEMAARMDALGMACSISLYLLLAVCFLLALHRIAGK